MLQHLHIRDFAIIDQLDLALSQGFTTISGETGAGKSIMVDALAFLLGARAEREWVRHGTKGAEIVGEFDLISSASARKWLHEQALDEGTECILRRSLLAAGGSRAWINGRPVTLGQLQSLARKLISIHGQNEHQQLLDPAQQRSLLDSWSQAEQLLTATDKLFSNWKELKLRLEQIENTPAADPQYLQLLEYQIAELKREALSKTEYQELSNEHQRLAHAEDLQQGLATALASLDNDTNGAAPRLQQALSSLQPLLSLKLDLSEEIQNIHRMLTEAGINLDESQSGLRATLEQCQSEPERLAELDQQLSLQHKLARKHQVEPPELISQLAVLEANLAELSQSGELKQKLQDSCNKAVVKYHKQARKLSTVRQQTAHTIGHKSTELLEQLGFNGARIIIEVIADSEQEPQRHGIDKIQILVRTNPGQPPGPIQKIASGGELSRISLALQLATRRASENIGITQIFDEVDAGIGGETANTVGTMLAELAVNGQVLCVTHLAQVAARADTQYQVSKHNKDGFSSVQLLQLQQAARIDEIARMLSGKLSTSSREHARELLAEVDL